MFSFDGMSEMQAGRVRKALSKQYNTSKGVMTLKEYLEGTDGLKSECDGMIDYNRTKFNRMNREDQKAYIEKLESRRHYFIGGVKVPKIVYDACVQQ